MRINGIYPAIEGEGVRLGQAQVFVRFQGCAVGCLNCDSMETWDFSAGESLSLPQILEKVDQLAQGKAKKIDWVSITGGDPMHPKLLPQAIELARALKEQKYLVNIEAAGTRADEQLFELVDWISFDIKTPSTGVRTSQKLLSQVVQNYDQKLQVKAVVADAKDFEYCLDWYRQLNELGHLPKNWVLTPCYNTDEDFPQTLFQEITGWNLDLGGPFQVIGQQHKWIYGSAKQNV
jgi:7-carboxy-7-deazaguanine synthase